MSNNCTNGTGELVLKQVTPVIRALFGEFSLDASSPGDGRAYIARSSEGSPSWESILNKALGLCEELGVPAPEEAGTDELIAVIERLAKHFGNHHHPEFSLVFDDLEKFELADGANLGALFDIAQMLDDGHGLTEVRIEGAYINDTRRLNEVGGYYEVYGRHFRKTGSTTSRLRRASLINEGLAEADLKKASEAIASEIIQDIESISDHEAQKAIISSIVRELGYFNHM